MSKHNELVDLTLHRHFVTDRAIRVSPNGEEGSAVWLPLSLVEIEDKGRGVVEVTMPSWLAEQKDLA